MTRLEIAVSRASSDDQQGPCAGQITSFVEQLRAAGVSVIWAPDNEELKRQGSIKHFMTEQIGQAASLCLFLSEDYLQSPYCMYELLVAYLHNYQNPDKFRERVSVCQLGVDLTSLVARAPWVTFWRNKAAESANALSTMAGNASNESRDEAQYLKEISEKVDAMLALAVSAVVKSSVPDFLTSLKEQHRLTHNPGGADGDPFPHIKVEIDSELAGNSEVAEFCRTHLGQYITGVRLLSDTVQKLQNAPQDFAESLTRIAKTLKNGQYSPNFCEALKNVLAGLLVLSVNVAWVLRRRDEMFRQPVSIAGRQLTGRAGIGRDRTVGQYSWLALSLSALMDTRPRLDRIFPRPGEPTPLKVPSPAKVMKSLGEEVQQQEIKQHFIKCILEEDITKPSVDPRQQQQFDDAFDEVIAQLKIARELQREPYFMDSEGAEVICSFQRHLRLDDLLLFAKPEGKPSDFLPEHMKKLGTLFVIFDLLTPGL